MLSLREILNDPNYINANEATKRAIFERYAPQDENFVTANPATQEAIRQRFGVAAPPPQEETEPTVSPVAKGKPAPVIPQLPVAPVASTVPEDEGFLARNYRYAKDALISGYESFRANTKGEAFAISRGAMLKDEEEYGGPGVPLAPPEVRERYERNKREAGQYAQDIAGFQKQAQERQLASPLRPETARLKAAMGDDLTFMESAKEAGAALFSNPVGVIADLGAESLPAMAYMVSTALIGRLAAQNPTAAAQAGGLGSAATQFGNEYVDRLQKGESHDEAWKNASIRSGVIGVFDAVSLKTAGSAANKIIEALKTGKPASVAAKEFVKEVGTQAGLGGAGEAAGSLAIGEVPNPAAVIAEMAGETVTGPFEAIGTYQRVKEIKKLSEEDKAIADLDKLNAEEIELEESILARANEIIGEFSDDGQTISMDDAYAQAKSEIQVYRQILAEETAKKEQLQKAIAEFPEEAQATPLESKQLIDKTLKKKLGRPPTDIETLEALYEFTQEKDNRLRAESGGRKPPVSVPSGKEAAAGVTGAPARTEPTGLGEGVGAAASVGARKEPTLAALKPEDLELDAAIKSGDINKLLSSGLVDYKELDTLGLQNSLTLARKRLDLRKEAVPTEAETTEAVGTTEEPTQTYEEALAEDYKRRGLDNPDEASKKIQESRNVSKKVADAYVQALRKQEAERIKFFYGLGSDQAFREALGEVEKIENRIRGVEKRREGKQPPPAKPTAPTAPTEPIRFRTVDDLSPEDRAAYESKNAEIRASMSEAMDAAKERGIPVVNAAAPFVDQLTALNQSYGLGERISEGKPEIRGVRPARDEDEVQTPATDPVGFARAQALASFENRNSSDYSDPEEAIDFGLDNLNDTLTDYGVTDQFVREQAVEAYKAEIARLQNEAATGIRPATDLDAELEQKAIELSLKVGDIHPTMVLAISNNDLNGALRIASQKLTGFSADLAKALLDLKLPTNISFNNGRDLVRRSIDSVSAQQQKRLFRYVEMHYPQVYDKYFKNYDRSESLEAVSKGLAELQKPNYNLGPVAAEFQTVFEAYDKSIEGLTAPGAYSPNLTRSLLIPIRGQVKATGFFCTRLSTLRPNMF